MLDLQPKMARILARYRIPVDAAEGLVEDLFATFQFKREMISHPERWLLSALQNRCLLYWRHQRERFCRALDAGLLSVLADENVPASEKENARVRIEKLAERLSPSCRERIAERYGLAQSGTAEQPPTSLAAPTVDFDEASSPLDDQTMRCLTALSRRMLREGLSFETADA